MRLCTCTDGSLVAEAFDKLLGVGNLLLLVLIGAHLLLYALS